MAPGAPEATGEIDFQLNLTNHHLSDSEKKALRHHVAGLGYVVASKTRMVNDVLYVTADMGKLEGNMFLLAYEMLLARIDTQIVRCKVRHLRPIRVAHR